uniref:Antimicrobial peptide n=1 Tax=Panagrellus redivivus TaxID=6233 RepID=A0A7E4VSZ7_PANRE
MRLLLFVFATILLLSIAVAQEYPDDEIAGSDQLEHELERFFLVDWINGGAKLIGKGIEKAGGLVKDSFHAVGNVFG